MANIGLILLVFAFVFAVIAACFFYSTGRYNFLALAVAFWIASELIGGISKVSGFH